MTNETNNKTTRSRLGFTGFMIFLAVLYIAEGTGQIAGLLGQPIRYLLTKDGWTTLEIANYLSLVMMPWFFKPVFGLMSDNIPLFGYRRKSYLLIANLIAMGGFWWVGYTTSIAQMGAALFLSSIGMAMTTTVSGALLVELGNESHHNNIFTSQQWLWFSIANMGTSFLGGWLTQRYGASPWTAVNISAWIVSVGPVLCMIATVCLIVEAKTPRSAISLRSRLSTWCALLRNATNQWKQDIALEAAAAKLRLRAVRLNVHAVREHFASARWYQLPWKFLLLSWLLPRQLAEDLWSAVRDLLRVIVRPVDWLFWTIFKSKPILLLCVFIFLYNYNPGFGTPLYVYQTNVLHLGQKFLGLLGTYGNAGSIAGALLFMFTSRYVSLRTIFVITILLGAVLQASAIIYTSPWLAPWGLQNTAIVLSVISGVVGMAGSLAAFTMVANYCPVGVEAYVYALLAAVNNIADPASSISGAWMYEHSFIAGNLQLLILVSSAVTLIALPMMFVLKLRDRPADGTGKGQGG